MSDQDSLRREITAARDEARIALDLALAALSQCSAPVDGSWDDRREMALREVAGKLHDLLAQEELLADLESVSIGNVAPALEHLVRSRGGSNDGGSTPQT